MSSPAAAAAIICRICSPSTPNLITFEASNAGRIDARWASAMVWAARWSSPPNIGPTNFGVLNSGRIRFRWAAAMVLPSRSNP